jgi:hypothetical protein
MHENEVRLIYAAHSETDDITKQIYTYNIDPNHLIDELLFDPRFDDVDNFNLREQEIKNLGFKETVEKSKLYQLPNFNIRLNH